MLKTDPDFKILVGKTGIKMMKCMHFCKCGMHGMRKDLIGRLKKANRVEGDGDVDLYMGMVVERLKKAEFLSGAEIGMLDLSLWGIIYVWAGKPVMKFFQEILDKYPIFAVWWLKMYQAVGEVRFTG